MQRVFLASATALLLGLATAWASPFEDGLAAYKRDDLGGAVKLFREAAAQGDVHAQTALGNLYGSGKGVRLDYAVAVRWYRLAAAKGYGSAQNALGVQYASGHGVRQDFIRAYMWFDIAAMSGEPLGAPNRDGIAKQMTSQQVVEAQRWLRDCQERGLKGCD